MKDDFIVKSTRREAIRPPARPVDTVSRPVAARRPISMDGMKPTAPEAHKSLLSVAPATPLAPITVAPAPVTPTAMPEPAPSKVQRLALTPTPKPESLHTIENRLATELKDSPNKETESKPMPEKPVNNVPKNIKDQKRTKLKNIALTAFGVVLLIVAGFITYEAMVRIKEVNTIDVGATDGSPAQAHSKEDEGKTETEVSADALATYKVSAEYPRALYVNKLNIASRIMPMSINTDGSVQAPINIYDAGWYTGSVKPGETGAAFIDGHASGPTREGLFAYLDTLAVGDTLEVETGNGEKLTFKVTHTETVPLENVDMKQVLKPYGDSEKALNLMTCTGKWLEDKQTYDQRVIVYTELV